MRGVGKGAFLEDFAPENPKGEAVTGHDDTRSRPLNERSRRYLTWESLTAVRPRVAPGEAQAKESR